jgi:hypothetical protein
MKKWIIRGSIAVLAAIGFALAQPAGVPGLYLASPTGSEQINVLGLGPQIETINLRQARDARGYIKSAATSGTIVFGSGTSFVFLSDSSTISTLTLDLTVAPADGQQNCFYGVSAISTLTMTAASGQTLNNGLTSTSAGTRYCWLYSASNMTWDRTQ